MSKVTMQDIADALGVSRISVWKALTNRPGISDSLRQQVLVKAAAMGYTASERANARPRLGDRVGDQLCHAPNVAGPVRPVRPPRPAAPPAHAGG